MKKLLLSFLFIFAFGSVFVACNDDGDDTIYTPTPPEDVITPEDDEPYLSLSTNSINFDARDVNNPQTIEVDTNVGGGYVYWLENEDDAQWVTFKKSRLSFDVSVTSINNSETEFRKAKVIVQVVSGQVGAIEKEIEIIQNPAGYYGPYYFLPENAEYDIYVSYHEQDLIIPFKTNMPRLIEFIMDSEETLENVKPFNGFVITGTASNALGSVAGHVITAMTYKGTEDDERDPEDIKELLIKLAANPRTDYITTSTITIKTDSRLNPGLIPSEVQIRIHQDLHPEVIYEWGDLQMNRGMNLQSSFRSLKFNTKETIATSVTEYRSGSIMNEITFNTDDGDLYGSGPASPLAYSARLGVHRAEDHYEIRSGTYTKNEGWGYPPPVWPITQDLIFINPDDTWEYAPEGTIIVLERENNAVVEGEIRRTGSEGNYTYHLWGVTRSVTYHFHVEPEMGADQRIGVAFNQNDTENYIYGLGVYELMFIDFHTNYNTRYDVSKSNIREATAEDMEKYPHAWDE